MAENGKLIIGTRASALALVQTHWVADRVRSAHPHIDVEIVRIVTHGDATQTSNIPLSSFGEKGIFVKELEEALLDERIDLAVHSMKDMAAELPYGLTIAAVPGREDPRDAIAGSRLDDLPPGAVVGTGSVRRKALLLESRPDVQVRDIRGNVDTRLRKLAAGEYDAILLAAAGLTRLGRESEAAERLDPEFFIPDPGQGALAIEARSEDERVRDLLHPINDRQAEICTRAERAYLAALGAGCQTPVGALATLDGNRITMIALRVQGEWLRRIRLSGPVSRPEELGRQAAQSF